MKQGDVFSFLSLKGNVMNNPTKRARRFATARRLVVRPPNHQKPRKPARRSRPSDRHAALIAVASVIKSLDMPKTDTKRHPIRIGIPVELDVVLEKKQKETGLSAIAILLAGAREYLARQTKPTEKVSSQTLATAAKRRGRPRKSEPKAAPRTRSRK